MIGNNMSQKKVPTSIDADVTSRRSLFKRAALVVLGAGVIVQANGGAWAAEEDGKKKKKKKKKKDGDAAK